jgi:hypothetical protein
MAPEAATPNRPEGDTGWIDEALAPLSIFVDAMSIASTAAVAGSAHVPSLWVERMDIELPFEMDVWVKPDGTVRLAASPPTQYTETTFMPVFHQVKLSVSGEVASGGDSESYVAS